MLKPNVGLRKKYAMCNHSFGNRLPDKLNLWSPHNARDEGGGYGTVRDEDNARG